MLNIMNSMYVVSNLILIFLVFLILIFQFFDGWEMNGYIFPAESDHEHHLEDRVVTLCKETFPTRRNLR